MVYELPEPVEGEKVVTLAEATEDRPAACLVLVAPGPSVVKEATMGLAAVGHPIELYGHGHQIDAYSRELCMRCIVRWEGIGRKGELLPLDENNLRALLSDLRVLGQLQREFVFPFLDREAEKNVSAPSSAGTSPATTGAKDTVPAVRKPARNAPTSAKPPKVAKAKPSGK